MEIMGIKFAPLFVPFERRLQTLAAGCYFLVFAFGPIIFSVLTIYLLLYTRYWYGMLLYLIWIWMFDRDTCDRGSRRFDWVRNLSWWKYMRDYFPLTLKKVPSCVLDPKKNYLFCSFPHGMLATAAFSAFATNASNFQKLCPNHTPYVVTLRPNFLIPFIRELLYGLGGCSASAESLKWILKNPEGGNIAIIAVGGAAEAFYCKPGQYRLVLKNRKGFIKIALQMGAPLVPVISFGETDLFDQVDNPEGSRLRIIQDWVKKIAGCSPIIPIGRGFFQYSFGLLPKRKPVTTLIGHPLEVPKIENPTPQEVTHVHDKFINHLTEFFEEYKHKYLIDADNVHLIIS